MSADRDESEVVSEVQATGVSITEASDAKPRLVAVKELAAELQVASAHQPDQVSTSATAVAQGSNRASTVVSAKFVQLMVMLLQQALLRLMSYMTLLTIYFWIAVFKNIQVVRHRAVLKVLSLTYYHNRLPSVIREDVNKLTKVPKKLACILTLKDVGDENGGVDGLVADILELAAWLILAGISHLTVYEYTGAINTRLDLSLLMRHMDKTLANYFGTDHKPLYQIHVPHANITTGLELTNGDRDLHIHLLLRSDGKPTIVELTKTMSELAQNNELSVKDILVDLINEELLELVGPEPDLLISFGPTLDFQDYPPWHLRLSEIYWEPDNSHMSYAVFLRALRKFSDCKMNLGK